MKKYGMLVTKNVYREEKKKDIGKLKSDNKRKEEKANQIVLKILFKVHTMTTMKSSLYQPLVK